VSGVEFAGLGAVFAITILVGLYAGQWLDRQLGTDPVMTVSGLFVAAAAGFYSMYRRLVTKQRGGSGGGGGRRSNDS
jgi:ATP synthase protein I